MKESTGNIKKRSKLKQHLEFRDKWTVDFESDLDQLSLLLKNIKIATAATANLQASGERAAARKDTVSGRFLASFLAP